MTVPKPYGTQSYAFWLRTEKAHLFDFIKTLRPVRQIQQRGEQRALIILKGDYDADEAWHFIHTELEREANYVELDDIWNDALWL